MWQVGDKWKRFEVVFDVIRKKVNNNPCKRKFSHKRTMPFMDKFLYSLRNLVVLLLLNYFTKLTVEVS